MARPNLFAALARVKQNGGAPGIDGMHAATSRFREKPCRNGTLVTIRTTLFKLSIILVRNACAMYPACPR
jgi:hypothetical protein